MTGQPSRGWLRPAIPFRTDEDRQRVVYDSTVEVTRLVRLLAAYGHRAPATRAWAACRIKSLGDQLVVIGATRGMRDVMLAAKEAAAEPSPEPCISPRCQYEVVYRIGASWACPFHFLARQPGGTRLALRAWR